MSNLKKVRDLKVDRFEYKPYYDYMIEEFSGIDQYKTADQKYHKTEEEANKHVETLLADRLRYNKLKKGGVLSCGELTKLFPNKKFLELEPAKIKVIDGVKKTEYLLYEDGHFVDKFDHIEGVAAFIEERHDVRWNLDLITTVTKTFGDLGNV